MYRYLIALAILVGRVCAAEMEDSSRRAEAPEFTLFDRSGARHSLREYRGKVVILNFWATWCKPCVEEIPVLDQVSREYKANGVVVLGVAMDERGWRAVTPFLAQRHPGYPIVVGGPAVARKYGGLKTLPFTVLIDRGGRIVATHQAAMDLPRLRKVVESLLAGQP